MGGFIGLPNDDEEIRNNDEEMPRLRSGPPRLLGTPSTPGQSISPNIARPSFGTNPVNLRGLPPPTPSAEGNTPGIAQRPIGPITATPAARSLSPIQSRLEADQNKLHAYQDKGSGISQIQNKPLRIGAKVLDTIGEIGAPRIASQIPGSEGHHQALIRQLTGRIGEELGEQKEELGNAETTARTDQATAAAEKDRADAKKALTPVEKQGVTPEETTIYDLMTGENGQPRINPETLKPFTYLEAYGAVKQAAQGAKPETHPAVGDASAQQYNASILRELNVNPKTAQKEIPPEYKVLPTDNDAQAKEKMQRAKDLVSGATGQQHITVDAGNKGNARSDKSYQLQSSRLDKLRTPVDQLATRFSRLTDTLDQASPESDALVGPELLTVMAGGMGSGLRMNEAEISRIVGGRSAWQDLQAAIQHWNTNPTDARSITAEQDKQIRALISAVHTKITGKQAILQKADEDLLDSDDPKDHRRIIADAEKQLNAIDAGGQTSDGGQVVPHGATHIVPGRDGKNHYTNADGTADLGVAP